MKTYVMAFDVNVASYEEDGRKELHGEHSVIVRVKAESIDDALQRAGSKLSNCDPPARKPTPS